MPTAVPPSISGPISGMHPRQSGTVCVLASTPASGRAKPRLAPILGAKWAGELAEAFLVDTWAAVSSIPLARPVLVVCGPGHVPVLEPNPETWRELTECSAGFGALLDAVVDRGLERSPWVLMVRGDAPGLPSSLIEQAIAAMANGALSVVVPSEHGGFALLGVGAPLSGCLTEASWRGGEIALEELMARLSSAGLAPVLLEPWYHVDEPAHLARLRAELAAGEVTASATERALRRSVSR